MRPPKVPSSGEDEVHHHRPAPAVNPFLAGAVAGRRKGAAASRTWLVVSGDGGSRMEEFGRHAIMRRTGLPARDLRLLDPLLSPYPSTILGRERAIVVNLEHIKAIITATEVLIANSEDAAVTLFVHDLLSRVSSANGGTQQEAAETTYVNVEAVDKATSCWPSFPAHIATATTKHGTKVPKQQSYSAVQVPPGTLGRGADVGGDEGAKVAPFEFRALEICLESACRRLESETLNLEKEAYPALDELTSKISTLNLEHVRQIKSRLVAISGRVQKVRDELEHLLDDDMDMAEMYLTEKFNRRVAGETSPRVYLENDELEPDEDDGNKDFKEETESSYESLPGVKPDIQELEMLLEAYFVQIDGTLNKLSHLREYVDDTEDYINIMLDDKQNQLLQTGVMLSTATVIITAGVVVVSLFGMNIHIDIWEAPDRVFWEVTFGTCAGCVALYMLAIWFGKRGGLLQ